MQINTKEHGRMLPKSFDPLVNYPQFILHRSKIPQNTTGTRPADPHDSANWMSYADAAIMAEATGAGVGFVFTETDPFFFIDLDHCYDPSTNAWNAVSVEIINAMAGACMEWSQSGTGVHIFGTYTAAFDHSCKNVLLDIELYTSGRFAALTGHELYAATGDAGLDCSAALAAVTEKYFTPNSAGGDPDTPGTWTTAAITPGTGVGTVADVIQLLEKPPRGGRARFDPNYAAPGDLLHANTDALARAYPSLNGNGPYDASSADMALAAHLAFITGGNCELIREVMHGSELNRDKWHDRPTYLTETITKAVGMCSNWYTPPPLRDTDTVLPGVTVSGAVPDVATLPVAAPGVNILPITQQIEYFDGCTYVTDEHKIFVRNTGALLKPDRFKTRFSKPTFIIDVDGKTTRNAFDAFAESRVHSFPKTDTTCFEPNESPGAVITDPHGGTSVNVFVPRWGPRVLGDASIMYDHIARLLPDPWDQQILISWMSMLIQRPGEKIPWAIFLQGVQGNGKSLLYKTLKYAIGARYCHKLDANDLTNKFNAWIKNRILIWCEEIWVAGRRDVANILKPMIADEDVACQAKGRDQQTISSVANFFFNSNKKDGVLKTINDRRYAVLYTAQQTQDDMIAYGMDDKTNYFDRLFAWLENGGFAIWANELATYAIPETIKLKGHAPKTTSLDEAIQTSGGAAEHFIREAIESNEPGFTGGLIAVNDAMDLLARNNKKYSPRKVGEILRSMNYDTHPSLHDSMSDGRITIFGRRIRIFSQKGHLVNNLETGKAVADKWSQLKVTAISSVTSVNLR